LRHRRRRVEDVIDRVDPHVTSVVQQIDRDLPPHREQISPMGFGQIGFDGVEAEEVHLVKVGDGVVKSSESFKLLADLEEFERLQQRVARGCSVLRALVTKGLVGKGVEGSDQERERCLNVIEGAIRVTFSILNNGSFECRGASGDQVVLLHHLLGCVNFGSFLVLLSVGGQFLVGVLLALLLLLDAVEEFVSGLLDSLKNSVSSGGGCGHKHCGLSGSLIGIEVYRDSYNTR